MPMLRSEKNFLEKLADKIPGISGYREREARRETDRRLREYLARRLEEGRESLQGLRRALLDGGEIGLLDDVGRLDATLQRAAASLRYADAGYSGLFDQVKIREEELDRIYAHDEALLLEVQDLAEGVRRLPASPPAVETLGGLSGLADELIQRITRRRDLFNTPKIQE